ncbi:MAG TPA: hypothetical protein VGQ93_02990, partial [Lysobacter sp.]|nr:hypothetical protein [Lysobacter sp.]
MELLIAVSFARHSRESGNPVSSRLRFAFAFAVATAKSEQRHWIPAFAGMTGKNLAPCGARISSPALPQGRGRGANSLLADRSVESLRLIDPVEKTTIGEMLHLRLLPAAKRLV